MITFKESIEIKNTIKFAEKCFYIMESYKISSINFVDWIESSFDNSQDINENLRLWLQTEINFLENYDSEVFEEEDITFGQSLAKDFDAVKNSTIGKKIGQWGSAAFQGVKKGMQQYSAHSDVQSMAKNVGTAKQKLIDLFKRGERQGSILSNDKIKTALSNIINMLQKIDPSTIGRTPQPANANKETAQQANVPEPEQPAQPNMANVTFNGQPSGGDAKQITPFDRTTTKTGNLQTNSFSPIGQKLFETRIKSICYKLDELKINPYHFATCFVDEFCEDNNINESGFIGGAWSGLKGAVKGGWDRLMGGGEGSIWDSIQGGYRSGRDSKYDDYDRQAIADAIKHLGNFSKQIEGSTLQNFQQQINGLITNLNKTLSYKTQQNVPPENKEKVDPNPNSISTPEVGETDDDYNRFQKNIKDLTPEEKANKEAEEAVSKELLNAKATGDASPYEKIAAADKLFLDKKNDKHPETGLFKIKQKWIKLTDNNDTTKELDQRLANIKLKVVNSEEYRKLIDPKTAKAFALKGKLYKKILEIIDEELKNLPADMPLTTAAAAK